MVRESTRSSPCKLLTLLDPVSELTIRVEHPNFEFSLAMDIRRDPHIIRALQDQDHLTVQRNASLSQPKPTSSTGSGIRHLFSSPRKAKNPPSAPPSRPITPQAAPVPSQSQPETIARYLATPSSSTIAKTHVAFKPIAKQCEAKVLEIRYPMFAMFKGEPDRPRDGGNTNVPASGPRKQVAKVTLQVFRLPPLPGIKPEDLPQCIDECLRGMRHHAWHECEYHEGNLTQEGGDCTVSVKLGLHGGVVLIFRYREDGRSSSLVAISWRTTKSLGKRSPRSICARRPP